MKTPPWPLGSAAPAGAGSSSSGPPSCSTRHAEVFQSRALPLIYLPTGSL